MFDLFFEFDTSDESPKLSIVGGGNPVASSKGTSYFNDMLGTTVGSKFNGKYSAVRETTRLALVLFEDADLACPCCGSGSCLGRAA